MRSLTEAAQARNTYIAGARDDYFPHLYSPAYRARRTALCERLLARDEPARSFTYVPTFASPSVDGDLRWMRSRLRAAGIDQIAAVDLTRDAIGVAVARVVAPGLEGVMDDAEGDYAPGARARRRLEAAA